MAPYFFQISPYASVVVLGLLAASWAPAQDATVSQPAGALERARQQQLISKITYIKQF
ncbi:MAG TPA: hypothetical protein VF629_24095 [Hymenobacter sp.]|jgi:hypothetical protein|uniref:hypothetical protein n=1 Tax=Hymenobacter sp. TaxID=1898978 RepID=UPI002ED7DAEA